MINKIWVGKGLDHLFNDEDYHCFKMSGFVDEGYFYLDMLRFEHEDNDTLTQDITATDLDIDNLNGVLRQCLSKFIDDNFKDN